ncbi:hypothetical protein CI105_07935 [Candidatus Izimaplasma bacterium ZiA1]|uniref:hypothetical protein n=1 Tax=Candidatus Izimoplasma sp. ZiA1 TaxID=2024899 RepID=UPI000BAA570D|nr:hypothetical protein CI105_07935 [Candidatus Izimaplasma bacterium ZiA1]
MDKYGKLGIIPYLGILVVPALLYRDVMFLNFMEPAADQEALGYQFLRFFVLSIEMIIIGAAYYGVRKENTEYVTGVYLPRKEKRFSSIVLILTSFLMFYENSFMNSFYALNIIVFVILISSGIYSLVTFELAVLKRKKGLKS